MKLFPGSLSWGDSSLFFTYLDMSLQKQSSWPMQCTYTARATSARARALVTNHKPWKSKATARGQPSVSSLLSHQPRRPWHHEITPGWWPPGTGCSGSKELASIHTGYGTSNHVMQKCVRGTAGPWCTHICTSEELINLLQSMECTVLGQTALSL